MSTQIDNQTALLSLQKRWIAFAAFCLAIIACGYFFLQVNWRPDHARHWLILAGISMIYPLWVSWRGLKHNYREGESRLLPHLGIGNNLTLLRGALVAALTGFLFLPRPASWLAWIPAVLYTLADVADYFDGYLARVTRHSTRLGEILDMSFDGIGVLIAAILAIQYGQVPVWYITVALARYLFLAGLWWRRRRGKAVYELTPSIRRRAFAGVQMGFLAMVLWPIFTPPGTSIAAIFFALPFLAGFSRDWLAVSGVLRPSSHPSTRLNGIVTRWLPVLLRLAIILLTLNSLSEKFPTSFFGFAEGKISDTGLILLSMLEIGAALLLFLGVAGRTVAILALGLLGLNQMFIAFTPAHAALLVVYIAILFLGTGELSLWTPEDRLIYHRAGEDRKPSIPTA